MRAPLLSPLKKESNIASTPNTVTLLNEFVAYIKKVLGVASILCTLFPVIINALSPSMIPPWPEKIVVFASGICAIVVLSLFYGIRHQSKIRKRFWGRVLLILTVFTFIGWLVSNAVLVVSLDSGYHVVRGFALNYDVSQTIAGAGIETSATNLLNRYGWNSAENIWDGVPLARVLVCIAFLLPFALVTGSVSAFALQDFK